jgi:hypothetical protein
MARGRPPLGTELVGKLEGSALAKERLKVFLQTLAGELTVVQACEQLQIGEARFHELRNEWLQSACSALEPKPAGRPRTPEPSEEAQHVATLQRQLQELKIDLRAAQIREQIALVMPEVMDASNDRRKRLDELQKTWERCQVQKKHPTPSKPCSDASPTTPKDSSKSGRSSS